MKTEEAVRKVIREKLSHFSKEELEEIIKMIKEKKKKKS